MDIEKAKGRRYSRLARLQEKIGSEKMFAPMRRLNPKEEKEVFRGFGISEKPKTEDKINET